MPQHKDTHSERSIDTGSLNEAQTPVTSRQKLNLPTLAHALADMPSMSSESNSLALSLAGIQLGNQRANTPNIPQNRQPILDESHQQQHQTSRTRSRYATNTSPGSSYHLSSSRKARLTSSDTNSSRAGLRCKNSSSLSSSIIKTKAEVSKLKHIEELKEMLMQENRKRFYIQEDRMAFDLKYKQKSSDKARAESVRLADSSNAYSLAEVAALNKVKATEASKKIQQNRQNDVEADISNLKIEKDKISTQIKAKEQIIRTFDNTIKDLEEEVLDHTCIARKAQLNRESIAEFQEISDKEVHDSHTALVLLECAAKELNVAKNIYLTSKDFIYLSRDSSKIHFPSNSSVASNTSDSDTSLDVSKDETSFDYQHASSPVSLYEYKTMSLQEFHNAVYTNSQFRHQDGSIDQSLFAIDDDRVLKVEYITKVSLVEAIRRFNANSQMTGYFHMNEQPTTITPKEQFAQHKQAPKASSDVVVPSDIAIEETSSDFEDVRGNMANFTTGLSYSRTSSPVPKSKFNIE